MATNPGVVALGEHGRSPQASGELGDLLVSYLEQLSVEYVFGVPGGAIEPLYNALARSARRGGPRAIVARHETGAAFMADGYAHHAGRLGVCCGTTGPGTTNLITGVASAYENHIPMLVITAQTSLASFGRGAAQESSCTGINTVAMLQYCTRYNTLVSHIDQFERKLAAAVMSAYGQPAGPAHLSIPLDVLRSRSPVERPSFDLAALLRRPSLLDEDAVERLCQEIDRARKVVLVVGDGCGEAISAILELACQIDAVIVALPQGKGLVSPYHPLFRGVIGFAGHSTATEVVMDPEVDAIVAIGTNLGEWACCGWGGGGIADRLIHVESTEGNLTRSPMAKLHVRGRIMTVFERVLSRMRKDSSQDAARRCVSPSRSAPTDGSEPPRCFKLDDEAKYYDDSAPIKPQRLMRELARLLPPSTRFLADNGNSMAWGIHYLHPLDRRGPGHRQATGSAFRSCLEFASMGWAIGSAVGAALGCPGSPVVCITGDGSLLMCGQEITVAVQEKLPVIFVVLNDSALGMVKHGQRLGGGEMVGYELPDIDYAAVARAMGANAHVIRSPQDLLELDVLAMCERAGPTLLDVRIDTEEVPPIGGRIKALAS
jgi:acetolactate synthase I/II/III large subunit